MNRQEGNQPAGRDLPAPPPPSLCPPAVTQQPGDLPTSPGTPGAVVPGSAARFGDELSGLAGRAGKTPRGRAAGSAGSCSPGSRGPSLPGRASNPGAGSLDRSPPAAPRRQAGADSRPRGGPTKPGGGPLVPSRLSSAEAFTGGLGPSRPPPGLGRTLPQGLARPDLARLDWARPNPAPNAFPTPSPTLPHPVPAPPGPSRPVTSPPPAPAPPPCQGARGTPGAVVPPGGPRKLHFP